MNSVGAKLRAWKLGIKEKDANQLIENIINEVGGYDFSDSIFLFHCLKYQQKQIDKLTKDLEELRAVCPRKGADC